MKDSLFGKTKQELEEIVLELGMKRFTADQLCDWLYRKDARSFDEMSNISKAGRAQLAERYVVGRREHSEVSVAGDGTKKYLYPVTVPGRRPADEPQHRHVEAAYIPEEKRHTLCLSTQVGCKMGCLFCMTARQGFQGQLSAGDVVNQLASLPERDQITNLVYMGMGEPLDNLEAVLKSLRILTEDC